MSKQFEGQVYSLAVEDSARGVIKLDIVSSPNFDPVFYVDLRKTAGAAMMSLAGTAYATRAPLVIVVDSVTGGGMNVIRVQISKPPR